MNRESLAIVLQGPIVTAIMQCILVADPTLHNRDEGVSPSFYIPLWTECQEAHVRENLTTRDQLVKQSSINSPVYNITCVS